MKRLILCFLVMFGVSAIHAQNRSKRLEGKVYVLTLYITESTFRKEDADRFNNRVLYAESFLSEQAARYGKRLEFQNGYFGITNPIRFDYIPDNMPQWEFDILLRAYKKIGYNSIEQFHDWVRKNTDATQCVEIVVVNKDRTGQSGVSVPYTADSDDYYCVVFMGETFWSTNTHLYSRTIAHEMLHNYGAVDLYESKNPKGPKFPSERFRQLVNTNFTREGGAKYDDVMTNLYEADLMIYNNVGGLTAWLIGWTDRYEPWYKEFINARK